MHQPAQAPPSPPLPTTPPSDLLLYSIKQHSGYQANSNSKTLQLSSCSILKAVQISDLPLLKILQRWLSLDT